MKAALPTLVKYSSFVAGNPDLMADRYDYGLAGDGWPSNCKRDANR